MQDIWGAPIWGPPLLQPGLLPLGLDFRECSPWWATGSSHGPQPTQGLISCFPICRSYSELTDCTRNVAAQLNCFWPNAAVDTFFVAIHQHYFKNCPVSGRAVRDPPRNILCPFIVVPILVTLLVTALVVWRSKRPEGIV